MSFYVGIKKLFVVLIVAVTLTACGDRGGDNGLVTTTRQTQSLQINLTTLKSARIGDAIPITLIVKNISAGSITVMLGGAPEAISQVKQGNAEIWNWATGKAFPAVLPSPQSIAPNETKTYDLSWDQKSNADVQVPSGSYSINSWFNTSSVNGTIVSPQTDLAAEPISVVIQ